MGRDVIARTPLRQRSNAIFQGGLPLKLGGKKCLESWWTSLEVERHLRITGENHEELLVAEDTHLDNRLWESVSVCLSLHLAKVPQLSAGHTNPNTSRCCCRSSHLVQEHRSRFKSQGQGLLTLKTYDFWRFFWQKWNLSNTEQRVGGPASRR